MEYPPGVKTHGDMIRLLAGRPLPTYDVAPLFFHTLHLSSEYPEDQERIISKFRSVKTTGLEAYDIVGYEVEEVSVGELIGAPILKDSGFNAYLRAILGEWAEDLPRRKIVPDLWFELTPLRPIFYSRAPKSATKSP